MDDQGREQALNRLIVCYEKEVLRVCCIYLRDTALAEDAVQETFLKAYKGLDDFRGESSEKTWLMRIAVNTCKDMRRGAWYRFADRRVSLEGIAEPLCEPEPQHEALTLAIMGLPRREMEVVLLRYDQGMQIREIAEVLGVSAPMISKRLKKAHERLRRALKGGEDDV